jgi:hypothetical protein
VRAGFQLDVVLESDLDRDVVIARRAMTYDVLDRRLIISQTSPHLYRRHIGKRVNASYLVTGGEPEKRRVIRMGIPATVVEYVENYPLSSSNFVPAFVLEQDGEPAEINLRVHYRVRPMASSDLTLLADGMKVNLIDLSLGGARFSHRRRDPPLDYGEVALTLSSGGRTFKIEGKIIRINNTQPTAGRIPDLEYVTVKFVALSRDMEFFLGKKILMIERQLMSEGKVVD